MCLDVIFKSLADLLEETGRSVPLLVMNVKGAASLCSHAGSGSLVK